MVLGTLKGRAVCTLALLGMISCAPPQAGSSAAGAPVVLDEAALPGRTIRILERHGRCVVDADGTELSIEPAPPCFFLRRGGVVQNFAYTDVKVDWMVIVLGDRLSDANRKTWNLSAEEVCGEKTQALLSQSGQVRMSKAVHAGGVYCRDKGVDEKEFWSFAHDRE